MTSQKKLRARIAELERELAELRGTTPGPTVLSVEQETGDLSDYCKLPTQRLTPLFPWFIMWHNSNGEYITINAQTGERVK